MTSARRLSGLSTSLLLLAIVAATTTTPTAEVPGPTGLAATRSVNMVSGNSWPNGDPFLQRQNEPSVAVSTRNTMHLLAGANDYRTVDLPGISTGPETGDAWLGVFKSFDGGERWQSTLLPGYPQDTSAEGLASPLRGYQAGADPVVRSGTNGLLYFSGLAFNRGENGASGLFLSRFIDNNNKENGDPIKYLGTTLIDKSTGADFIDKPWMAVDIPRAGAKVCKITQTDLPPAVKLPKNANSFHKVKKDPKAKIIKLKDPKPYTQSIQAGMIYVAYSRITTVGTDITSRIMFTSSDDCGVTWAKPVQISAPEDKVNQGATIAVDPATGAVAVAWRQFGLTATSTDSIVSVRSEMKKKWDAPVKVHKFNAKRPGDKLKKMVAEHRMGDGDEVSEIQPFDQGSAEDRFRTNAYPSIAFDDESRAYLAWTERGYGVARSSATEGDARVVVATSKIGAAWTAPRAVDVGTAGSDMPGHQLMPSIAFAAGKLVIVYYDLREDVSQVFTPFVTEKDAVVTVHKRHTIDIRSAYALKGDVPVFGASTKVSQYTMGSRPGSNVIEQMQYNAPNLPLFKLGTVPFMGDYIDLAASPAFVQTNGTWKFNTTSQVAPVFHVVWTDNRDVRPPADGNWANYTPVKLPGAPGTFDVNQPAPACVVGQTGMRNQNIYSARLTFGLVTGSPGNSKPLDPSLPRGFVVFAQNTSTAVKSYRMTIAAQPTGGKASFNQSSVAGLPDPLLSVDVTVPAKSMVTRTVFVTSTDPHAQVPVDVKEISAPAMPILAGGLASRVVLNPDISNPDISNPDISNPDISNPDISNAEVYNPDISNPDISNPDISNPDISNPDISNPDISNIVVANPDISNPDISNPDISNPDISNPDISNPDISNPDISNGALTDVTWTIVNTGNTTASFNVNLFLANAAAKLGGVKTQLVVHKTYVTPIADGCTLKNQVQTVLVANVPNPTFNAPGTTTPFDPSNSAVTNTTVWLEPGGTSKITLRIIDPNPQDQITIDPVRDVTPVVTAEPKNTEDIGTVVLPPATTPPTPDDLLLNFSIAGQPTSTILTQTIAPVTARALLNGLPSAGVQVTVAIANNPAGGHLSGTTTRLTDANGNATFNDLSIEKAGIGYKLSASASAFGALPDLSVPFNIIKAPVTALASGGTFVFDGNAHAGECAFSGPSNELLAGSISWSSIAPPVNPGTYTVTCSFAGTDFYSAASDDDVITIFNPYLVTSSADNGALGTLRNAITAANTFADVNTITFAIPGGAATINLVSPLPAITQPVVIDGLTQPGSATWAPQVSVVGTTLVGGHGFTILTAGATLRGLRIHDFPGSGVIVPGGNNGNTIEDNVITSNNLGVNLIASNSHIVRRNVLSDNAFSGILLNGGTGTTVSNNRIGTSPDGMSAMGNVDNGVTLFGGATNMVIDSNVISGNNSEGIEAQFSAAPVTGLRVINNIIGLDANGDAEVPNRQGGVALDRTEGALIGEPGGRNVISGNGFFNTATPAPCDLLNSTGPGIRVSGASALMPWIRNNYVGLNLAGTAGRPNKYGGIELGSKARVGGPGAGEGNLIAGNGCVATNSGTGVLAFVGAGGTIIQGNTIGISTTGVALNNGYSGITVNATGSVVIGGVGAGEGNVITGNTIGVAIYKAGANPAPTDVKLSRNQIGSDIAGTMPGNASVGVQVLDSTGVVVGGAAADSNIIHGNGSHGVQALGVARVTVLSNTINNNGGLGFDLGAPANGNQASPVLSNASNAGPSTTVDFTLVSDDANTNHTIQVFVSAACDPSGRGEGSRLEGTFNVMTDLGGNASGPLTLDESVPNGSVVSATVTDAAGNTSEFSTCATVTVPAPPSTITSASPSNGKAGEGFIVLRGNNLPTDVAVFQGAAGPANGFIMQSSSNAGAVWVRMPFGYPLGAGTITLKNAAGTTVSNAFPFTITANPGTPVITALFNSDLNNLAGAVAAGATIYISADGIDTAGAVARYVQGANTWDVPVGSTLSNQSLGLAGASTVPAAAAPGPIAVSIRQGASAFSASTTFSIQSPQVAPVLQLAGNTLGFSNTLIDFSLNSPAGNYTLNLFGGASCETVGALASHPFALGGPGHRVINSGLSMYVGAFVAASVTDSLGNTSVQSPCMQVTEPGVAYSFTTDHYYQYVLAGGLDWNSANAAANGATFAGRSGKLVSITSAHEQTVVNSLYTQMGLGDMRAWIGLYDFSGGFGWSWTTGEPLGFMNWGGGEPNNMGSERAVEFFSSGQWNNNSEFFGGTFGYVVEYQ